MVVSIIAMALSCLCAGWMIGYFVAVVTND